MKKLITICLAAAMIFTISSAVNADWIPEDGHKMHYPQLPKQGGWDVEFAMSRLADDWQCTSSGAVTDIHLWVSWMENLVQPIGSITVSIYSDQPAVGSQFSRPDEMLWTQNFLAGQFDVLDMADDLQGWYDPSCGAYGFEDHTKWQQINITDIANPLIQQEGTIYWLVVDFGQLPFVGWKESGSPHFNDDAVWWDCALETWQELRDPVTQESLDLAFVITPEPTTIITLAIGSLAFIRRKK
ncbi:MAG: PEP-CTERM sorting domain-containing protein [Phycisphaerae bacterium]|nr:PEP-CTERM sorting domain-containing protein [Phycisphaerae bacterium]